MILFNVIETALIRSFICAKYKFDRFAAGLAISSGSGIPSSSGGKPPLACWAANNLVLAVNGVVLKTNVAARRLIYPIPRNLIRWLTPSVIFISRPIPCGWAGVFPIPNQ